MFIPPEIADRMAAAAAAGDYHKVLEELSTLLGPYDFAKNRAADYFHAVLKVDLSRGTYMSDGSPAGGMMAIMAARALEAAGPGRFTAAIDGPGNEPIEVCPPGPEPTRRPRAADAALAGAFAALIEREIGGLGLGPVPYHPAPKRPRADDDEESPAGPQRHRDDLGLCPRPGDAAGARLVELELRNAELARANVELERRMSLGIGQLRNKRCCCGRKGCSYTSSLFAPR